MHFILNGTHTHTHKAPICMGKRDYTILLSSIGFCNLPITLGLREKKPQVINTYAKHSLYLDHRFRLFRCRFRWSSVTIYTSHWLWYNKIIAKHLQNYRRLNANYRLTRKQKNSKFSLTDNL